MTHIQSQEAFGKMQCITVGMSLERIEPSSVFEARRFNNECSIPSAHCRSVDSVRIASHGPTTNEPELCCNRSGRLTVSILNLLLSKDLLFFVLKLIFARIQIELATQIHRR